MKVKRPRPALIAVFCASLPLAGCGGPEATHLPRNPLMIPVLGIGAGLSNAAYDARRAQVSTHVEAHHGAILQDVARGHGEHLQKAADLARVPQSRRAELLNALRADPKLYEKDAEALVVALMVHGN